MFEGRRIPVAWLFIPALVVGVHCAGPDDPTPIGDDADPDIIAELPITSRSFEMGTAGFVPKNYPDFSEQDFEDFLWEGAAAYGGIYGVHIHPADDLTEAGVPGQIQLAFEQVEGVEPYVAFAMSYAEGPFTEARGEELKNAAVATVEHYSPKYLFLGVEANGFALFHDEGWDVYVDAVRETYDAVKAVSSSTRVGNNFQLDWMKGEASLTGHDLEPNWELIDDFEGKIDVVSFTVFPFFEHASVDDIPDDYLGEIRDHTDLPVVITETGWPTEDLETGVSGSADEQIDYLKKLAEQANGIEAETVIWVLPHDGEFDHMGGGVFNRISLFHNDGTSKPAYEYWKALHALPLE